jgi:GAF domain-containing protein
MKSPLGVVVFDTELQIAWANRAAELIGDGLPAARWPGRRLDEVLPGLDVASIEQSLRQVLATGQPVFDLEVAGAASRWADADRFWRCIQLPVSGPDGQAAQVAQVMQEVTGHALGQHRLALADEASARIGSTLDIARTAEELLDVAVPRLADAGRVNLLGTVIEGDRHAPQAHNQKMRLLQVALRWPDDAPLPPEYLRKAWYETDPAKLLHQRLVAGLPIFLPTLGTMTEEQIREVASGTAFDRVITARRAGAHSQMIVPLMARGAIMGHVILYRLAGSKPFTAADLSLARDFVARAAVSIDNARLYTRERATALALQRGLLPRHIPQVPGLHLAYRYVPAQTTSEIGGDWFDVIPLADGRCALTVGDVTGHDISAASRMGQLRTATRTLAGLGLTPAQLLTRLDLITADLTDTETSARPGPPRPGRRVPRPAPRPAARHRPGRRRLVPGHPPAPAPRQHRGPVHRRAHRRARRRHRHRHGAPGRRPGHRHPAAPHPGLRHPAGHPRLPPGRRYRHPHGPDLTPGSAPMSGYAVRVSGCLACFAR